MRSFAIFFAFVTLAFMGGLSPLRAESLFDEGRLQSIVERQSSVLVRVKAAVDVLADVAEKIEANDATKSDRVEKAVEKKAATLEKDDKKDDKGEPKTFLRLGTGFFISTDGQIITNASVVDGAKRVWYEVNGVAYLAEVKAIDIPTNIALLQAKTMPKKVNAVNIADSVSLSPIGSVLLRLSLPLDFPATPTVGIVQGADAQFGARGFPTRYLRVALGTGPGEAGSPVFDLQGRFVGSTIAVIPELGAAYVLPARALNWVKEGLVSGGHVYSYFGFTVDEEHTAADGVRLIVKTVDEKGPASSLKVGDIVFEAAHKSATTLADIRDAAFYTKPGQYLDLKVKRGNQETAVSIQAQEKK